MMLFLLFLNFLSIRSQSTLEKQKSLKQFFAGSRCYYLTKMTMAVTIFNKSIVYEENAKLLFVKTFTKENPCTYCMFIFICHR